MTTQPEIAKVATFEQREAARRKLPIGCVVGTGSGTAMCGAGLRRFGGDCSYPDCEKKYKALLENQPDV